MATLRPWKTVIDNAIAAYRSGQYVYFYGAKNIILTEQNMEYLIAAEPGYWSRYGNDELKQIKRNSVGRRGVDCSGFVGWVCTGDQQWSTGQINNCSKYNSIADGPAGSILYTSWNGSGRHIGLDIGGDGAGTGYCLQAGYESTDARIRSGKAGIFLSKLSDTPWERSGQSNVVSYSGVYSPYAPSKQLIEDVFGRKPSTVPLWVGQAIVLVNVRSTPEIKNDRAGNPLNPLYNWPRLGAGNLVDVCDTTYAPGWYYVRIAGKYYGWVKAEYIAAAGPRVPEVGSRVRFTGQKIYASSYKNGKGIDVPNFDAKVTQKNDQAHPYLIKAVDKTGYEGWANTGDIKLL